MNEDVFIAYKKKFGKLPGIPMGASEEVMEKYKKVLKNCIEKGKPYTADMFPEKLPEGRII